MSGVAIALTIYLAAALVVILALGKVLKRRREQDSRPVMRGR